MLALRSWQYKAGAAGSVSSPPPLCNFQRRLVDGTGLSTAGVLVVQSLDCSLQCLRLKYQLRCILQLCLDAPETALVLSCPASDICLQPADSAFDGDRALKLYISEQTLICHAFRTLHLHSG